MRKVSAAPEAQPNQSLGNKVTDLVKGLMCTYPALYKSRLDVLINIFLRSTYHWGEDGCLRTDYAGPLRTTMDFSDIDALQAEAEGELKEDILNGYDGLAAQRIARLKRERSERQLIADDIDLYAAHHVMGENYKSGIDWLKHVDLKYCSLADAPYDCMDVDYAKAAEEVVKIAARAVWEELGMMSPHYTRGNANAKLLKLHDGFEAALKKLDAITGSSAIEARCLAMTEKFLANILPDR